jgi:cytidylate kinase
MPAITISREIGSRGDSIAELAARRLGYQLVDKKIIAKIFCQYGFVDFEETYDESGVWTRFDPHHTEMVHLLKQVVEALVYHGDIILLGRGGFSLLKGLADVLNVRIQAPFELRVARTLEDMALDNLANAETFVRENDRMRRTFVDSIHSGGWNSSSDFDLVIDTGKISPELAVDWLEDAIRQLIHNEGMGMVSTHSLEIDSVMLNAVTNELSRNTA